MNKINIINGNDIAEIIISSPPKQPSFRDNYNSHLNDLQNQLKTATQPHKTILRMQLECGYKAFII